MPRGKWDSVNLQRLEPRMQALGPWQGSLREYLSYITLERGGSDHTAYNYALDLLRYLQDLKDHETVRDICENGRDDPA